MDTDKPVEVNTNMGDIIPTAPAGAAPTNSDKAVHKSSNRGDVVEVNVEVNVNRKNKNLVSTGVVKNQSQSHVKNSNCEKSG